MVFKFQFNMILFKLLLQAMAGLSLKSREKNSDLDLIRRFSI